MLRTKPYYASIEEWWREQMCAQPFPIHCPEGEAFGAEKVLANEGNKVKCQQLLAFWSVGLRPVCPDFPLQEGEMLG